MSRTPAVNLNVADRVIDRVSHLIKRRQQEVDKIVRILRSEFVSERPRSPRRGKILAICLVGDHARIERPDKEDGVRSTYEIWAIVDHPEYRGLEQSWGPARRLIDREVGWRCRVELSVFDDSDMERAIRENSMIREKAGSAIVLYDGRAPGIARQGMPSSSSP